MENCCNFAVESLFTFYFKNRMKYIKLFIFLVFGLFYVSVIYAQEHSNDEHEHARNEIGVSSGALYAFGHNKWGGGAHIHYFRTLGFHSKLSLGGSFEQAWVDGRHFNLGAGVKYQLFNRLSIATFPGITFFSHKQTDMHDTHEPQNNRFTLHFELVYDLFHLENFHAGMVLDYSLLKSDSHAMIGIHAAFCF